MITLYRKEADGRLRYYNIHDHQLHLEKEWAFTVSYTVGDSSWREAIRRFSSAGAMDSAIRTLLKRKRREGYGLLYSFGGKGRGGEADYAQNLMREAT